MLKTRDVSDGNFLKQQQTCISDHFRPGYIPKYGNFFVLQVDFKLISPPDHPVLL